ncbi:MAG: hypothetical protein JJ892_07370 [Balneola sp.]|nr:hypothetical protein [Balneola sp.]MBO6650951.1 hypothetical protein [Balneola sp.]MBO6711893.1 hypothetical protein [Balneola sp.]MBO6800088.1 hypothetical protein [Balneola sp.]MBO6871531.1 hypothetical protein [Balneola sp.]
MNICLVEENTYKNLLPITSTRPLFGVRCGRFTLEERIFTILESHQVEIDEVSYVMRKELEPVWKKNLGSDIDISFNIPENKQSLILNGSVLWEEEKLIKILSGCDGNLSKIWIKDNNWIAIYVPKRSNFPNRTQLINNSLKLEDFESKEELNVDMINSPWEVIDYNSKMIQHDFELSCTCLKKLAVPPLPKNVFVTNSEKLIIGNQSEIYPFVTLDSSKGPIIIGDNVTIEPGVFIKGPVSIGDDCLISANTKIYQNTTLGNTCKIGGELSNSIIHGYSNKEHYGFLGNSYVGEWVNLGAGTTNSNLKNNYNFIKVDINGERVNSGSQFVGAFIGDFTKTAIGSHINNGCLIGVGSNIFGCELYSKKIDHFTWGAPNNNEMFKFQKFIESIHRMMVRRNVQLTLEQVKMLRVLYKRAKVARKVAESSRARYKKPLLKD